MSSAANQVHRIELAGEPAAVLAELARAAADWGGSWRAEDGGGRLELPVLAGLRYGLVSGRVTVEATTQGSCLTFEIEESRYRVQTTAAVVLALAAVGALVAVVAPFFPPLAPLIPHGILLSLGAWLFIVARLRNSGPDELLATLAAEDRPTDGIGGRGSGTLDQAL